MNTSRLYNHFDSAPPTNASKGTMKGFDPEFTDIVDYITRITYRIWEGKQVGLCYDYYSEDCPIYTLAGMSVGAEVVVQNTIKTLAAFPDRTLHADNVIWGGNDEDGYHSSHLISTQMTNLGPSEFGPATGKNAIIAVIAHCVVKTNQVIEEWLVRDNYSLVQQLGLDPVKVAQQWASKPIDPGSDFAKWRDAEIRRVRATSNQRGSFNGDAKTDPEGFIRAALQNIWNARMIGDVSQLYANNARLQGPSGRDLTGPEEIRTLYTGVLGALPDARLSMDYICSIPYQTSGVDIAVRWTLAGTHNGAALYGEPTGEPILIIGESHYRIEDNLVIEERTVFDELSVLTQVYRARGVLASTDDTIA
ncbi:MAG: ester cyclase [Pseudomonadales bacterium]